MEVIKNEKGERFGTHKKTVYMADFNNYKTVFISKNVIERRVLGSIRFQSVV